MKKRLTKIFISCLVICVCMAMAAPAAFADGETTYVVSFRPGEHGSFSQGAVGYLSSYGNVQMTATGNLFLEVTSGTPFPAGILSYLGADAGYYYRGGLAGGPVTEDMTYVAQFGILSGSGVRYTVRYVDSVSGAEVAESYTGYANAGDVIPFTAKTVTGYDVDSTTKSITVSEGAELSFYYTSNGTLDEIHYVYGQDTVITQTVVTPQTPNNNTENNDNDNGNDDNAGNGPEVRIEDNEVPLGGGEVQEPVQIEDENVPLAGPGMKDENEANSLAIGLAAGAGALVLIGIVAAVILSRKKKKAGEE